MIFRVCLISVLKTVFKFSNSAGGRPKLEGGIQGGVQ